METSESIYTERAFLGEQDSAAKAKRQPENNAKAVIGIDALAGQIDDELVASSGCCLLRRWNPKRHRGNLPPLCLLSVDGSLPGSAFLSSQPKSSLGTGSFVVG